MFLTKECDYGVRIIRALADGELKTVEVISSAEFIPHKYCYKILKKLEHAGFLKSSRGRDGGYRLIKSPDDFSIFDVIITINGNLFLNECLKEENSCPNNTGEKAETCAVHKELKRIQKIVVNEMKGKSVKATMEAEI